MIRRAEERDIPRMLKLLEQVNLVHAKGRADIFKVATKYSEEDLKEAFKDENQAIFVYVDDSDAGSGEVEGYAFTQLQQARADHPILTDILTVYVDDICVDEESRGKHIGTRLYEAVLDYAKGIGAYNVTLNVWALNQPAMKFYESCGMVPQRTTMETIL